MPTQLVGALTLHGVTRPADAGCQLAEVHPAPDAQARLLRADASGSFNRDDFDLGAGKEYGFKMNVDLRIQVETIAPPLTREPALLRSNQAVASIVQQAAWFWRPPWSSLTPGATATG